MNTKILSYITLGIALVLAYFLINSIKFAIDEEKRISQSEEIIINKLKLIREAEKAYQEVNSTYTANWDTLIHFIENGKYPILNRSEKIIELAYGEDSIVLTIDTIDIISAREYIFIKNHDVFLADDGEFLEFFVKIGQEVKIGQKIYSMISATTNKEVNQIAKNNGVVTSLKSIAKHSTLKRGTMLLQMREEKFDPKTNVKELAFIPMTVPATKFDLFADRIESNRLMVNVIEVRDTNPINPNRKESNEVNNLKPLRFGSRTEITTAGNWE